MEGIGVLHGEIRPAGDEGTRGEQRTPRIGASQPLGAQARLGPAHVRRAVGGLHAGDDAEPGEARNISLGEDLRVLDAQPVSRPRGGGRRREGPLERVEGQRVRPVADGVDAHSKAVTQGLERQA